ncbi:MAG TPA: immune inhibitor A domain-containing protein [Anaerolineales bacterium]|nr:immune inhibitor A domain-containing protein [Anaerolineales bacterium]
MKAKWFSTSLIVLLLVVAMVPAAGAAPSAAEDGPIFAGIGDDNLSHPKGDEQAALKAKAMEAKVQGKANGNTHEVAKGQYVELALEKNDRVFVIIAEFGETIHPLYGQAPGPLHNEIEQPDRAVDNTTIWQADYNKAHYEDMYFNQMVDYYAEQSSGRYTINGDVTEWVKVPHNEARYGNNACGSSVCSTVWYLIRDAINIWTADRLADGWTHQDINDYLTTFDVWDRYDADGDGNFDEADGYIDHFQIVHAGVGEETGGGAQGTYAIWSHRWYTAYQGIGVWGPPSAPFGGMEFGGDGTFGNLGGPNAVGVWVGDYTMQPENGGLGVFAHEYAHDLGLPDQYDTAGGENSTGFWTIMSSGSYLGDGTTDIGSRPGDFNAWEKFQLGWLNYEVAFAGAKSEHKLGPAEANTKQAQGLFVVLPDKEVTENLAAPYSGSFFYYSGAGDNVDNTMSRSVALPAGAVTLTAQVNYQIELDWDYAYLTVNGTPVATSKSTGTNPNGQNFGNGITGASGGWVGLTADLSAFAGQTVDIGFRYWTDGAVVEPGFMVDDIQITGLPLDDAESDFGWTFDGFRTTTGTETAFYFNAYVAEFRQYRDYDTGLQTGPYNFGFLNTLPDWVEHFPYQDGLLISYWDSSFTDNNTSQHPGGGLILPIDSHPNALIRPDSTPWRARVQAYDSTFTLGPTDGITLHINGNPSVIPSLPGVSVFNDATDFWDPSTPLANVITPNTGTTIRIKSISAQGGFMQVAVNK